MSRAVEERSPGINTAMIQGRVSSAPVERQLPSGDVILSCRVVVSRGSSPMAARSKQVSDWLDCVAWGARAKRSVARWEVGDTVEIEGALRRRFFRTSGGGASRVEVEVLVARLVERAVS